MQVRMLYVGRTHTAHKARVQILYGGKTHTAHIRPVRRKFTCYTRGKDTHGTIGGRRPGAGDIVLRPPTNEVRVALAGKSLPALLAAPACQLAPPRATRSAPVAWALRTPDACGKPDLRLALRARRSAHGAARLCAGRHSRWLPSPPRATRSAPMAWARCAPGRLRQPGRGLALRARRRWRGRRAPGRLHVPPPITRALPLSGVDVEDVVRFALLESSVQARASRSCQGRGWGGVFQTSSCTSVRENASMLPQHVQCESARRATATGAPYPQARPIPRTLSA